jgi:putative ABC transport system permease protein
MYELLKDLFKEKTRIILTILAITWGTFSIATMLAIGQGLSQTFKETMANTGDNLLAVTGLRSSTNYRGMPSNVTVNLTRSDVANIAKLPNVAAVSPQYSIAEKISYGDKNYAETIYAVTGNYSAIHQIKVLPGGRFISPLDLQRRSKVIVLGSDVVKDIFPDEPDPTGRIVKVGTEPFLVIGVMKPKSQIIAEKSPDSANNWIPVTTFELFINAQIINSIDISYRDPKLLDQLESQIQQAVALNHGFDPNDNHLLHFREYSKRGQKINDFFSGMRIFLGVVGALTLMVAGVGISNVMYASIQRATREIGIRMALGARTFHIVWHYVVESLLATFIGGLLGLGLAGIVVYGLRQIPLKGKLIDAIGQPHPTLSLSMIFLVIIILGITGLLSGIFPALKAARIDPAEALSYE